MHRCRDILEEILPTRVTRHLWTIPVELPLPFFTLAVHEKKVTLKLSRDWFVQLLAPVRYKTMTDFSRFSAFQKWKYLTFHFWYNLSHFWPRWAFWHRRGHKLNCSYDFEWMFWLLSCISKTRRKMFFRSKTAIKITLLSKFNFQKGRKSYFLSTESFKS